MFILKALTPMRPVIVGLLQYGLVFSAVASVLGLPVTISACVIGWLFAAIAVGSFIVFAFLLAWRWRELLIILSVAASIGFNFFVGIVTPLSIIIFVAWLLHSGDPFVVYLYGNLEVLSTSPQLGARIGTWVAAFFWAKYLYSALTAIGFISPRLHTGGYSKAKLIHLCWVTTISVCILGLFALLPVTLGWILGETAFLFLAILLIYGMFFCFQAQSNYRASTVVKCQELRHAQVDNVPWAIHFSDIHVTMLGGATVEGGSGGNRWLHEAVQMQSINSLSFVFITGDLTDHGEPEEWIEAVSAIDRLKDRTHVLIAPGNHDLSIAYSLRWQFWTIVSRVYGKPQQFEHATGAKMWRFLKHLGMLNSEVRTSDGQRLAKHIHLVMLNKEEDLYRSIASNPGEESELIAGFTRWMLEAGLCHPERVSRLEADLRRQASNVHRWGLSRGDFDAFAGSYIFDNWSDYFPMHQFDATTNTLCVILNSVVTDTSLIGSAFGMVQPEQITRLKSLLKKTKAHNIIILMHHAPFRWSDERSPSYLAFEEVTRWGSLAVTYGSGEQLFKTLKVACRGGRRVLLLCGHRHGGQSRENRIGKCGPLLVAESAALGNSSTMEFLALSHRPGGGLRLAVQQQSF